MSSSWKVDHLSLLFVTSSNGLTCSPKGIVALMSACEADFRIIVCSRAGTVV